LISYQPKNVWVSGPDGGEDIQPAFAYTKDGKVSTILRSGFKSGPVSIKAVYYNDTSISTNTSQVAINAGPPVGEEFGISAKYSNISGLYNAFLENEISINAGDVYGNMIPDNTVISWTTTHKQCLKMSTLCQLQPPPVCSRTSPLKFPIPSPEQHHHQITA
jgi:hypothetical protein